MLPQNDLSSDEILSKLDQTSKKARVVSIILTVAAVLILAVITFITALVFKEYSDLSKKRDEVKKDLDEAKTILDDYNIKIKEAEYLASLNSECTNIGNVLAAKTTIIDENDNPTVSNTSLKNSSVTPTPTPKKVTPPNNNSPSIVYIQIVDESQRPLAEKLKNSLQNEKFQFPGIENKKVNISQTQIRFFGEEDESRAKDLAQLLQDKGISARVLKITYKSDKPNLPLEIWFSNNAFAK